MSVTSLKSLKMCFLNVGGIVNRGIDKFRDPEFIKTISSFDIVLLAETHLGPNYDIPNIDSFFVHTVCRSMSKNNRHFGGLAILCKHPIKKHIKILQNNNPDYQWIKLEKGFFGFEKDVFICLVYYPPPHSSGVQHDDIFDSIEKDVCEYSKLGDILMWGDFNARTSNNDDFITNDCSKYLPCDSNYEPDSDLQHRFSKDKKLDSRGKDLLEFCISHQIRILNGRVLGDCFGNFTCFTPNGCSTVDYCLAAENLLEKILYFKVNAFNPIISDCHCLLQWKISSDFVIRPENECHTTKLEPKFQWSTDSATKFELALSSPDIKENLAKFLAHDIDNGHNNVNTAANELTNIILSAAKRSLNRNKQKPKNPKNKIWFNSDLRKKRKQLTDYARVFAQHPYDRQVRDHFFKLRKEYSKSTKLESRKYKQDLLNKIETLHENDPKKYWDLINKLRNKKDDNTNNTITPSAWIRHFSELSQEKEIFKDRINFLESSLQDLEKAMPLINSTELDYSITMKEVSTAIERLHSNKSPGLDQISNRMLKHGKHYLLPGLTKLFNACFNLGQYPSTWSDGIITAIHKSGNASDTNNYRGITITSVIGKLFNSIINSRLDKYFEKTNLINESQIGFRKEARTSDHMFILKNIIDTKINEKHGRLYACFVDFRKAFDTVIHAGIKLKLLKAKVGTKIYKIIKSMYAKSRSCVRVDDLVTDFFNINVGVKQGDNLSPTLFKLFINDLPQYLENTADPIHINGTLINCLMYADDIVLLSNSADGLQQKLYKLQEYCNDWCLSVNVNKTKVIVFNKAGRLINTKFFLDNKVLECVQSYKYLGILFSASGSFTAAQEELYKKALKALFKLQRDFLCQWRSSVTKSGGAQIFPKK